MTRNPIDIYYDWLIDKIASNQRLKVEYSKLLMKLWETPFFYSMARDENREMDGVHLRAHFEKETGIMLIFDAKCSLLEMMVALALRCDDQLMWDDTAGSRAGEWFFLMIDSMMLIGMKDNYYDDYYVTFVLNRMMNHQYMPNGRGGLFTTFDPNFDMREKEIWFQMSKFITENDDSQIEAIIKDLHVKELFFGGKEE